MKKLKTSTQNAIIVGVTAIISAIIGLFAGGTIEHNTNNAQIQNITQVGIEFGITPSDSMAQIFEKMLDVVEAKNNEISSLQTKNMRDVNELDQLKGKNEELNQEIEDLKSQIRTLQTIQIDSLDSEVEATLYNGQITINVNDSYSFFHDEDITYPLTWSVWLSNSSEVKIGDYYIRIEIEMDRNNLILDTNSSVYQEGGDAYLFVKHLPNNFKTTFNTNKNVFVINGNFSNSFLNENNLIINAVTRTSYD